MLQILDNKLGGCLVLFVLIVFTIWSISPSIFFDDDGTAKNLYIGSFSVNRFGVCVVVVSILIYYFYAVIKYSFDK